MDPVQTEDISAHYIAAPDKLVNMNLHNHSTFSDGSFTPEYIVRKAIDAGLTHVAITDHYMSFKRRSLDSSELEAYMERMDELKEKYREIRVLTGVEIEAARRLNLGSLRYDLLNSMDIVLFEYVNDDLWGGLHLWELFKAFERIDIPIGLSHNEIGRNFKEIDYDSLLKVMDDHGIFVELAPGQRNSKFGRPFYRFAIDFFRMLRDTNVMVSIGTDTHNRPEEISDIKDAVLFVEEMDLWQNLITQKL